MKLSLVVVVTAVVLVTAVPAGATTKPEAFANAKTCLAQMNAGLQRVSHRSDGGGFATYKYGPRVSSHGTAVWVYRMSAGQVRDAAFRFVNLPVRWEIMIRGCVRRGI